MKLRRYLSWYREKPIDVKLFFLTINNYSNYRRDFYFEKGPFSIKKVWNLGVYLDCGCVFRLCLYFRIEWALKMFHIIQKGVGINETSWDIHRVHLNFLDKWKETDDFDIHGGLSKTHLEAFSFIIWRPRYINTNQKITNTTNLELLGILSLL